MRQLLLTLCTSSLGKKYIMAVTGLGAIGFLGTHLGGNLVVFAGRGAFNSYAHHLHAVPFLSVVEIGLFALFAVHMIFGAILAVQNWRSRPIRYAVKKSAGGSNVASATMIYSGLAVFVFMVLHAATINAGGAHVEAYDRVVRVLTQPWTAITYILGVLALGLHLFHGAKSTMQSLGMVHPKYDGTITFVGRAAAVAFTVGFASIPIYAWLVLSKGLVH